MSLKPDYVIRGGHLIDPYNNVDNVLTDVSIHKGKVFDIGQGLPQGQNEFDATGYIVCPGLIDLHTHVYEYATTLGVNPDKTCLLRGVTTVVDGGSSGAMTFEGLKKYICENSQTRVLAFLHVACHGLAGAGCSGSELGIGGESDSINAIKKSLCCTVAKNNLGIIVGLKVRLDKNITDNGRIEHEVFKSALEIAEDTKLPLMVHHTNSGISFHKGNEDTHSDKNSGKLYAPGSLRFGDIYTHTYSRFAGRNCSMYSFGGKSVRKSFERAREKGVIFDVGHGQGSFDWCVAENACSEHSKFWPDVISTDLHTGNVNGPVYDLPNVMSKFLHLGMPLFKVIKSVTEKPAEIIKRQAKIGSLSIGAEADITILKLVNALETKLGGLSEDCHEQCRNLKRRILPIAVFRAGKLYTITN